MSPTSTYGFPRIEKRVLERLRAGRRVRGKLLLRTSSNPFCFDLGEETVACADVKCRKMEEAVAPLPHAHFAQTACFFAAHSVPVTRTLDHLVRLLLFVVPFEDGGDGLFLGKERECLERVVGHE